MIARYILVGKKIKIIISVLENQVKLHYFCQNLKEFYKMQRPENSYNSGLNKIKEALINQLVKNTFIIQSNYNSVNRNYTLWKR